MYTLNNIRTGLISFALIFRGESTPVRFKKLIENWSPMQVYHGKLRHIDITSACPHIPRLQHHPGLSSHCTLSTKSNPAPHEALITSSLIHLGVPVAKNTSVGSPFSQILSLFLLALSEIQISPKAARPLIFPQAQLLTSSPSQHEPRTPGLLSFIPTSFSSHCSFLVSILSFLPCSCTTMCSPAIFCVTL